MQPTEPVGRNADMRLLMVLGFVAAPYFLPVALHAQTLRRTPEIRADTFIDRAARSLVIDALRLRDSAAAGLQSYEATVMERTHVGLAVTKRLPLRERTLYHREQVARVHWQSNGMHRLLWTGRREGAPTTGDKWADRPPFGIDFDIVEELGLDDIGVDLLFDPFGDRLDVFDAEFVQPISAEGLALYQFASNDTMEIRLPAPDRTITLIEVIVTPRTKAWETVEGSLWFDRDTGTLVRAAYRPSGVWDHEVQEPGDLDDVPGFLKPGIGIVESIVIEYGLYERRWWLPRRMYGEGVYDWGHGLLRMPLLVEWTMSEHVLNEAPTAVFSNENLMPTNLRIEGDDGRVARTVYLVPSGVDLSRVPELPGPLVSTPLLAFTGEELKPLLERIEEQAGPPPGTGSPSIQRALLSSIRYDRVRGPSTALGTTLPVGPLTVEPHVRAALAIPDLETTLGLASGAFRLDLYRRIEDASDWNHADGLGNSAATFLFGHDGGDYYRVTGTSLGLVVDARLVRAQLEVFAESHRSIARQTNISLTTLGDGSLRPNIDADRIDAAGIRTTLAGQVGVDVQDGVFNWRLQAEAASGDADWARSMAALRFTHAIGDALAIALDVSAGVAGKGAPVQREFLLGGAGTIRGVSENAIRGPAFWLTRVEAGYGLAGLRAIGFLDAGWAGPRDSFQTSHPATGVGAGVSFMDGLFRLDVARGLSRSAVWRMYFHMDALL